MIFIIKELLGVISLVLCVYRSLMPNRWIVCWLICVQGIGFFNFTLPFCTSCIRFYYRAMHFSAKRGIAIACRLSVCLSVRPSVCPSVSLVNCDHIDWNSSKIISQLVRLGRSLFATPTRRVCSKGNTTKFGPKVTYPLLI